MVQVLALGTLPFLSLFGQKIRQAMINQRYRALYSSSQLSGRAPVEIRLPRDQLECVMSCARPMDEKPPFGFTEQHRFKVGNRSTDRRRQSAEPLESLVALTLSGRSKLRVSQNHPLNRGQLLGRRA